MGRAKTTGRFKTREELVDTVWAQYLYTQATSSEIAKYVQVSDPTVGNILNEPRPEKYNNLKRDMVKVGTRNVMIAR